MGRGATAPSQGDDVPHTPTSGLQDQLRSHDAGKLPLQGSPRGAHDTGPSGQTRLAAHTAQGQQVLLGDVADLACLVPSLVGQKPCYHPSDMMAFGFPWPRTLQNFPQLWDEPEGRPRSTPAAHTHLHPLLHVTILDDLQLLSLRDGQLIRLAALWGTGDKVSQPGQGTKCHSQAGGAIPMRAGHPWLYLVPKDNPAGVGVGAGGVAGLSILERLVAVVVIELGRVQPRGLLLARPGAAGGPWVLLARPHGPSQPGIHIQPRRTQQGQPSLCLHLANLRHGPGGDKGTDRAGMGRDVFKG